MNRSQPADGIVKRTGAIANYTVKRDEASFVFSDSDRTKLGVIAVAAGLAGLSGQAIAAAGYAASTVEAADWVEFDLDGHPVKGWVWRSPFKDGDQVDVVGQYADSHFEAVAIARPSDRTIALYPHCSRGSRRHVLNAARWWVLGTTILLMISVPVAVLAMGLDTFMTSPTAFATAGVYGFFGLMTISLTRRWMPFVRTAEKVFRALEWPNPSNVDLVKSTKAQRKPDDPGELGTFYFRY